MKPKVLVSLRTITWLVLLSLPLRAHAQTISATATVNWTDVHQTIDGFGAFADINSPTYTDTMFNQLFSTTGGAGLSVVRIAVPQGTSASSYFNPNDCTSVGAACYSPVANFTNMAAAGVKLWASSIGPPASMKSNGSVICNTGSGNSSLLAGSYPAYATWQANFIASLAAQGINLYALSVQNEPNFCPTTYEGAIWTGAQLDTYIKTNLGPAIAALPSPQNATLIMAPEATSPSPLPALADPVFTDSSALAFMGIAATHGYISGAHPHDFTGYANANGMHVWETEVYGGGASNPTGAAFDGSIADGLVWAQEIHNYIVDGNVSAWHYWLLNYLVSETGDTDNEALYGPDGVTPAKRLWVMGQWARFVRPGWVRIDCTATPQTGVFVSCFKDPVGVGFAIVVVNTNGSTTLQTFSLAGFPSISGGVVTPYVTSPSLNIAAQATTAATSSITYPLLASSVTTFVGTSSSSSMPIAAPTNLRAVVQ
jgi:glucuronoarabinoxylan endo-1,4-beta-xylanase